AQMVRLFCGRSGGALDAHGTMGHPGRLSFCIAEHGTTLWPPFHTQFGLPAGASVVSVLGTEGPNSVNNHYAKTGDLILETIADCAAHAGSTSFYYQTGMIIIAIGPEHMRIIASSFSREEARAYLFDKARRPTEELSRLGRIPSEPPADGRPAPKVVPG